MINARKDPIGYLTGKQHNSAFPPGVSRINEGGKFTPDGATQPWPGNTIICHVDQKTPAFEALKDIQNEIKESPFGGNFKFLPPESFHMTVFQGYSRFLPELGFTPEGLSPEISLEQSTEKLVKNLENLAVPTQFRVKPVRIFTLHSVTMTGADHTEEKKLRDARGALRDATQIMPKDFDEYVFHITLAYLLNWVEPAEAEEMESFGVELSTKIINAVSEIELGSLELCTFQDMCYFECVKRLGI